MKNNDKNQDKNNGKRPISTSHIEGGNIYAMNPFP